MSESLVLTPLSPALGARVDGVDLCSASDALIGEIRAAWLRFGVLVFSNQTLSPADFVALARRIGKIGYYPFVAGMPEHPEIVEVVKLPQERHNFGGLWHTDTSYLERPPMASLLWAVEIPPVGGDTLFASSEKAYEALSEGFRAFLGTLRAVSSAAKPDAAVTRVDRRRDRPTEAAEQTTRAVHPVVRVHPETGRRALYLSPGHTTHIEGMTEAESRELLAWLFRHMTQEHLTCRLRWQRGDLAIWDNRCTLHNALNDYHGHGRVMRRITLEGERPR